MLIIIAVLIALFVLFFYMLGVQSKNGHPLGLKAGYLAQCGDKPNCVCSEQLGAQGDERWISPIPLKGNTPIEIWAQVSAKITELGGEVNQQTPDYLAANFTSRVFGFVDDLELRLDAELKQIHVRSASRVGHSDLGKNNQRVDALSAMFQ
ncbi:MAG: DUF1499 domain-containing protein [Arenicellales bacterium]